ncbi:MAG: glutamate 5-kinase [Pseudomonadota bacterium]
MTKDAAKPPDQPASHAAACLGAAARIVIKLGSALVSNADGKPDHARLAELAGDLALLRMADGSRRDIILVSSGAVALGKSTLGLTGTLRLDQKQAAAAVGQSLLVQAWQQAFAAHDLTIAQILLTLEDTEDRRRYLNATATLETLLSLPVVPLVNENDTIATAEIRYGDNDRLAAHTAQMTRADLLILLSDIDGLYDRDPRAIPAANHIPYVDHITDDHQRAAGTANTKSGVGSGGMATKLHAAQIATRAGISVIVADGNRDHALMDLQRGTARATLFAPTVKASTARRQWIAGRQSAAGSIKVDAGAVRAIENGSSLLAAGITGVAAYTRDKPFRRGDLVDILSPEQSKIALGLCTFDHGTLQRIKGCQTGQIMDILGETHTGVVVHRNDLVLAGP